MPVPPIPKVGYWQDASSNYSQAGYWQDASSTDCQGRLLARCPFHRLPRQVTGKMPVLPIPDSRFPIPDSLSPYLPPPEWQSRWGNI
ncbi:hypothetical protein [Moorena producens]|uniref:hypothetical protein n=1 Tax=Moorena producens TaxID=1155739 RepID=UPI0011EA6234|nr:hypothetical protein [Moorena producens]